MNMLNLKYGYLRILLSNISLIIGGFLIEIKATLNIYIIFLVYND